MDGSHLTPDPAADDERPEATAETDPLRRRRDLAMASIERERVRREAAGYAAMSAVMSFAPATEDGSRLARLVHASKLFLIAFVCLAPNYLVWRLLLSG